MVAVTQGSGITDFTKVVGMKREGRMGLLDGDSLTLPVRWRKGRIWEKNLVEIRVEK